MISLRGKLALITGGSRGIGLAIAQNFARQGASTILVARNAERLGAAVASVQAQQQQHHTPASAHDEVVPFHTGITGDVSSDEIWQRLSQKLVQGRLGHRPGPKPDEMLPDRVDILVNCAGITQESLLWRTDTDKVAAILDTNLRGAVLGCKYISKLMAKKHDGMKDVGKGEASIINVSSVMATMGGSGASVYAASKAGLLGLTSALSLEMRTRMIRVNALVPGYIETDMTQVCKLSAIFHICSQEMRVFNHNSQDCPLCAVGCIAQETTISLYQGSLDVDLPMTGLSHNQLCNRIPLGRLGKVEEVADAAAFLAQNSYANNCVLTIDGGLSAGFFA